MTISEILERTRGYIKENFMYTRPDHPVGDDDRLLELGIIDSMGVMELIEFIQDEFAVVVEDDEITEENLGTIRAIADYITAKSAPDSSAAPVASEARG